MKEAIGLYVSSLRKHIHQTEAQGQACGWLKHRYSSSTSETAVPFCQPFSMEVTGYTGRGARQTTDLQSENLVWAPQAFNAGGV